MLKPLATKTSGIVNNNVFLNFPNVRNYRAERNVESKNSGQFSNLLALFSGFFCFAVSYLMFFILTRTIKVEHITPFLKFIHWLRVAQRKIIKIHLLFYKSLTGLAPAYVEDLLPLYQPHIQLRFSNSSLLRIKIKQGEAVFNFYALLSGINLRTTAKLLKH